MLDVPIVNGKEMIIEPNIHTAGSQPASLETIDQVVNSLNNLS